MFGTRTNDQTIKVVKQWYSDIADLRARHKLVVFIRDNAGENESQEIKEFFGTASTKEQWQNGVAESTTNSIMLLQEQSLQSPDWVVDLVQGGCGLDGCVQYDIQGAHQDVTSSGIVQRTKRYF